MCNDENPIDGIYVRMWHVWVCSLPEYNLVDSGGERWNERKRMSINDAKEKCGNWDITNVFYNSIWRSRTGEAENVTSKKSDHQIQCVCVVVGLVVGLVGLGGFYCDMKLEL